MRYPEYRLDEGRRTVVLRTIREVADHRGWRLWAVHVRSNHVHIVVTTEVKPEKVMVDLKAWSARRLRETFEEESDRVRWAQHGSTKYLWSENAVAAAGVYVVEEQGEPRARFDARSEGPRDDQKTPSPAAQKRTR